MEEITTQLLRPGTFAVAVAVVVVTFFLRRIVETLWPTLKKQAPETAPEVTYLSNVAMWWNTVVLYAVPVLLGVLIGLINSDFLHGDIKDVGGRILFQAGVGWFAGFLYKILRKIILKKTGVDIQPSPASGDADVTPTEPADSKK
jgi:mannose/fructose/N-acetylgalactosamine-specific phosphotransferase system component IIC